MRNVKERVTNMFSLPKEIVLDLPLIQATGRGEVNIENYKNLLEFAETKIRLGTKDGIIVVEGEGLKLQQVTSENVLIAGRISGISYL